MVTCGTIVSGGANADELAVTLGLEAERRVTLPVERLVIASNPCTPIVPRWAQGIPDDVVQLAGTIDLRRTGDLRDFHVLVVGGGLTAAHLACGAVRRGRA